MAFTAVVWRELMWGSASVIGVCRVGCLTVAWSILLLGVLLWRGVVSVMRDVPGVEQSLPMWCRYIGLHDEAT